MPIALAISHAKAEHHFVSAFEIGSKLRKEHTAADDAEVNRNKYGAKRHVMILVDRGCDDVCATG